MQKQMRGRAREGAGKMKVEEGMEGERAKNERKRGLFVPRERDTEQRGTNS